MPNRIEQIARNDRRIAAALASGRISCDVEGGIVFGKSNQPIGTVGPGGYVRVSLAANASMVLAHRIIWCAAHGFLDPARQVNHRNKIRHDNRAGNLELLTPLANAGHQRGTLDYVGVRPEDVALVSEDRPDWYCRALALAASGSATAQEVAALRAEVSFETDPLNPLSDHQRNRGMMRVRTRGLAR